MLDAGTFHRDSHVAVQSKCHTAAKGAIPVLSIETVKGAFHVICGRIEPHRAGIDPGPQESRAPLVVILGETIEIDAAFVRLQSVPETPVVVRIAEVAASAAVYIPAGKVGAAGSRNSRFCWRRGTCHSFDQAGEGIRVLVRKRQAEHRLRRKRLCECEPRESAAV